MKYIVKIEIDNVLRNDVMDSKIHSLAQAIAKKYSLCRCDVEFSRDEIKYIIDNTSSPQKYFYNQALIKEK